MRSIVALIVFIASTFGGIIYIYIIYSFRATFVAYIQLRFFYHFIFEQFNGAIWFSGPSYRYPLSQHLKGPKIVGGQDAADGEFPHQVQVRSASTGFSLMCGGSVLNQEYVITAAHCCYGILPRNIHVVAGGTLRIEPEPGEEQKSDVKKIIVHEDYKPLHNDNDICLLHVR